MNLVYYDTSNGKLRFWGHYNPQLAWPGIERPDTASVLSDIDPIDPKLHYVFEDELVERPEINYTINKTQIVADDVDTCIISNLPIPCHLEINHVPYDITDGVMEFTSDIDHEYEIVIDQFPYLLTTIKVTAA